MATSAGVDRRLRCGETPRLGGCDGVTDTGTRGSDDGRTPVVSKLCSFPFGVPSATMVVFMCACVTHFVRVVVISFPAGLSVYSASRQVY